METSESARPGTPRELRALDRTESELEAAAEITDRDLSAAAVWWRAHAPERYRDLLEATPTDLA